MGRRTVVPGLLICVAISVTGCWVERDAYGKLRIYGKREFQARERYLERTQPERFAQMRSARKTGYWLLGLGAVGMVGGIVYDAEAAPHDWSSPGPKVAVGVGLVGAMSMIAGAAKVDSYSPYIKKEGRRRGQLLIGPNGGALVYRF